MLKRRSLNISQISRKIILNKVPDKITITSENIPIEKIDEIIKIKYEMEKDERRLKEYIKNTEELIINRNISQFIKVAKLFIDIEFHTNKFVGNICQQCGENLDDIAEKECGSYNCPNCKICYDNMVVTNYISNLEDIPIEPVSNFTKILDKYEGINSVKIPKDLFEKLNKFFKNTFQDYDSILKQPLLPNGKKSNTSKIEMWKALEEIGYSKLSSNINYICHIYWGWELPKLENIRNQLLEDHKCIQNAWLKIKSQYSRKASLGNQFTLYAQLTSRGYKGPISDRKDFKIQDSSNSLRIHNSAFEEMARICSIPFHPVL
jgi:hypothetical protein